MVDYIKATGLANYNQLQYLKQLRLCQYMAALAKICRRGRRFAMTERSTKTNGFTVSICLSTFCLSFCLCVQLFLYLISLHIYFRSVYLLSFLRLSIWQCNYPSVRLSIVPVCLSVCLSLRLSSNLPTHLCMRPSFHLFTYPSIHLYNLSNLPICVTYLTHLTYLIYLSI